MTLVSAVEAYECAQGPGSSAGGEKGYNVPFLSKDMLMKDVKHVVLQKDSQMYLCH